VLALTGQRIRRASSAPGRLDRRGFRRPGPLRSGARRHVSPVIDGVCLVVREPLDRFQEIIAQSWKWRGGFCVPTDVTANPTIIPTAGQSCWKRAVVIECL